MPDLPVSVVIVSRDRASALLRCLTGVSQLQYDPFEVIVVADAAGEAAVKGSLYADRVKLHRFDAANISAARNMGIAQAAGEIVAFLDDDAVPEPTWLRYLVAPAAQREDVAAMGGFVRGRNGISFQWRAQGLDSKGEAHALDLPAMKTAVLHPPEGRAIKTEGTNMAFRRSALVALGGFDPAFHYFLDETDLNMRLARAGHATALVPLAEVHHGFAANAVRTSARVPRDLFDIGASWAVFHRKYAVRHAALAHWNAICAHQRQRVMQHMVAGRLEPRDIRRLMARLKEGYAVGAEREIGTGSLPAHPADAFLPFDAPKRRSVVIPTRPSRFRRDLAAAAERVKNHEIVTLMSLSRTAMYHSVAFDSVGVWVQRGGIFGRSDRDQPLWRFTTRHRRIKAETARVARQRGLSDV